VVPVCRVLFLTLNKLEYSKQIAASNILVIKDLVYKVRAKTFSPRTRPST